MQLIKMCVKASLIELTTAVIVERASSEGTLGEQGEPYCV